MPESFTERRTIRIVINGVEVEREVGVRTLLADLSGRIWGSPELILDASTAYAALAP